MGLLIACFDMATEKHMNVQTWVVFSTLVLSTGLICAQDTPLPPPASRQVEFSRDIDPILERHCYSCHGPSVSMNGYSMWRRKSALRGGYSGLTAIEPGNSAESRLIQLVAGLEENLEMPPTGGPLSAGEISLLRAWIDQGAEWAPEMEIPEEEESAEWLEMDYGSLISSSITVRAPEDPRADKSPSDNVSYKAHAISLTPEKDATVLFDTELLRYAAGWTGGFLVLTGTVFDWKHGPHPYADGEVVFETPVLPGWGFDGKFVDPRPGGFGSLPKGLARYRGRYVFGDKNILSYSVNGTHVLDMPTYESWSASGVFKRSLEVAPHAADLLLEVAFEAGEIPEPAAGYPGVVRMGELAVAVVGSGAEWVLDTPGHLRLSIPGSDQNQVLAIYLFRGAGIDAVKFVRWVERKPPPQPLRQYVRGGPARFEQTVTTAGKVGSDLEPWVVDEITLPSENPWNSWMRPGDFGFFQDDRAAITTWSGDVWIVDGVDHDLDKLVWRRYATGFNQPLGIEIVDETVYVLDRNQVTRLHDLNGDGEADYYENFNNDFEATHHFHEFTFDLDRDGKGTFYFAKAARHALPSKVKHHGTIMKLDPSGEDLEVVCKGFRVPNGVAISPQGYITTSDQEGHWIPSTPIAWCEPGSYHGYAWGGGVDPSDEQQLARPITYLPIEADNSGAGQAWVLDNRWGPFTGHLLHASYGRGRLFVVFIEDVEGTVQGGAFQLPIQLDTGILRPGFRSRDGQLYTCGLRGWGTTTKTEGGFYRVRYTGQPVTLPTGLHVSRKDGISLRFTQPLERDSAEDKSRFYVRRWNYERSSRYGSERFRMDGEMGTEQMAIESVRLSPDQRSLFLKVNDLREVDQMLVGLDVRAADGKPVGLELFLTINRLADQPGKAVLAVE